MKRKLSELDIRAAKILARRNLPKEARGRWAAYVGTHDHAILVLNMAWKVFVGQVKVALRIKD